MAARLKVVVRVFALGLAALAMLPAAARSPLQPGLVDRVFADDSEVGYCFMHGGFRSREGFVRKSYDIQPLDLRTGQHVVILRAHTGCLCGAQNCPVSAYVQHGGDFRLALSGPAIDSRFEKNGTAVITSHDSALVSVRETYLFRSSRYVLTKDEIVNNETGEAKPSAIPVRFAPGANSTTLRGHVVLGFPDTYIVTARKGQVLHVSLNLRNDDARVSITLVDSGRELVTPSRSWSGALPANGDYRITVDGSTETTARYALTISIK
jgi:hypothetical protein